MIRVICRCGHVARVEDALAGKRIPCPRCGEPVSVPAKPRESPASPKPKPRGEPAKPADTPAAKRPAVEEQPEAPPEKPEPPKNAQKPPARPEEALGALAEAASPRKDHPRPAPAPPKPASPATARPAAAAGPAQPGPPRKAPIQRPPAARKAGAHRPQPPSRPEVRRSTTMEAHPRKPTPQQTGPAAAGPPPDTGAKAKAVFLGLAMLASLFIPWGIKDDKLVMSWQVLQRAEAGPILLLVAIWVVGLAAVLAGALLRSLALAAACLVLGAIGLAAVLSADEHLRALAPWLSAAGPLVRKAPLALAALLLMAQMVATRLRPRLPTGAPTRLAGGLLGAGTAIVAVVSLILLIVDYAGLEQDARKDLFYDFVFFLGLWVCLLVCGLLAALHAAATAGGSARGRLALLLGHLAVFATMAYVIGRLAFSAGGAGLIFPAVNVCLLAAAPWWLAKFALAAVVVHVRGRLVAPPAARQKGRGA